MPRPGLRSEPVSPALIAALRAQLAGAERLAWAASPEPSAIAPGKRGPGKWEVVAILGGGYATLGSCVAAVSTGRWLWFAVPIALLGCAILGYLAASRVKARARSKVVGTVYGLTTRRALIVQTYPKLAVRALPIDAITEVSALDPRDEVADLCLRTAAAPAALVFQAIAEPERARAQLMRVIRDPRAAEQEIVASEAYSMAMHQLAKSVSS